MTKVKDQNPPTKQDLETLLKEIDSSEPEEFTGRFQPGKSGNVNGRPKKVSTSEIGEDDKAYYGTDSRKFLERALLKAKTWEEGLKFAKELRMLQHPSLQSVATTVDNVHTLTLRWSRPDEISSNEKGLIEAEVVINDPGKKDN